MTREPPSEKPRDARPSLLQRAKNFFSKGALPIVQPIDSVFASEEKRADNRRNGLAPGEIKGHLYGLALSGGGIRSATFSLGVLQGLSRARSPDALPDKDPLDAPERSLLARFDYLSTVSGGGYIGAFLCSLFVPNRLRARETPHEVTPQQSAIDAYRVFQYEPPGRIRSNEDYLHAEVGKGPLALLRESGRYLASGGAGDFVYVIGLAIRNWLSVQYVLGTFLAAGFALLALLRLGLIEGWTQHAQFESWLLVKVRCAAFTDPCTDPWSFWWSPFWVVSLVVVALWLLPVFAGFWLTHPRKGEDDTVEPDPFSKAAIAAIGIGSVCVGAGYWSTTPYGTNVLAAIENIAMWPPHVYVLLAGGVIALLGVVYHVSTALGARTISAHRVAMTRIGSSGLLVLVATVVVAITDTLSQSLYLSWASAPNPSLPEVLSPAAVIAAVVWIFRQVAALTDDKGTPSFLKKLPIGVIAGVAGMLLFFAIATAWGFFVQWIVWMGLEPGSAAAETALAAVSRVGPEKARLILASLCALGLLGLALTSARFSGFLNLSSLQSFYGARLTRAYLGASNGNRFKPPTSEHDRKTRSVAEPVEKDQLSRHDYYEGSLAPLHIINVTVNQTIDPAEKLVQRDRKGKPLAVLPSGFSVDRTHYNFRDGDPGNQKLTIGQWIGTSGAAFTTGLGRSTSLGTSIALGLANVRLGMWWASGHGKDESHGFGKAFKAVFKTQAFLFYELTATFHGLRREWAYLSDGGHFENTGLYELVRPGRKVQTIVACDNGCDPLYRFQDLATLIRTARIDHRTRIEIDERIAADKDGLGRVFGTPEQFQKLADDAGGLSDDDKRLLSDKCALLLNVYHTEGDARDAAQPDCRIIVLKPRLIASVPIDVREYHAQHREFPQQSTSDQFFDEAQWESYRCLGSCIARRVFVDHGAALWAYLAKKGQ